MTLEVSPTCVEELSSLIQMWLGSKYFNKKKLQSLIGKLSFVTNCVRAGCIFISRLLETLRGCEETINYEINEEMYKDLQWWKRYLPEFSRESLLWLQDTISYDTWLASDASLVGGRATHNTQFFHYKFPDWILSTTNNIAQREMYTIVLAVKLWRKELAGKVIRFYTDNENSHVHNK